MSASTANGFGLERKLPRLRFSKTRQPRWLRSSQYLIMKPAPEQSSRVPFAKAMHFAQNGLSSIRKQK